MSILDWIRERATRVSQSENNRGITINDLSVRRGDPCDRPPATGLALSGEYKIRPYGGLEIALRDDIIDVCIDGSRTLIDRCPERRGDKLLLYAQDSAVTFEVVAIAALP